MSAYGPAQSCFLSFYLKHPVVAASMILSLLHGFGILEVEDLVSQIVHQNICIEGHGPKP